MMSMEQMYQAALRLPEQRLLAILSGQDDSLPQAVVGAALRMRKRMQQSAVAQQAMAQQGEPTHKDKMLAEYGGIADLPAEFDMSGEAERGIASFAAGGPTESAEERDARLLREIAEFQLTGGDPEQASRVRMEREQLRGETGTAPQMRANPFAQYYDRVYAPSIIRATNPVPSEPKPKAEAKKADAQPAVPALTKEEREQLTKITDSEGGGARVRESGGIGALVAGPKRPEFKEAPVLVRKAQAPTLKGTEDVVGGIEQLRDAMGVEKPRAAEEYIDEARALGDKYGVNRDPYRKLRERLEREDAREGEDMRRARSEALINAGLGMLGGRSQYAGVNIARGAQSGLDQYRSDRARLEKAGLERAKALADIEKANSDIARGDVERGMAARAKAVEAANKASADALAVSQRIVESGNRDALARYQVESGIETADADRASRQIQSQNELAARMYQTDAQTAAQLQAAGISAAAHRDVANARSATEKRDRIMALAIDAVTKGQGVLQQTAGDPGFNDAVARTFLKFWTLYQNPGAMPADTGSTSNEPVTVREVRK